MIGKSLKRFRKKFNEVKGRGYILSSRTHDTGIGKTFEDCMGLTENNSPLADFQGWEIKTKRITSRSLVTLFTLSPLPPGVNDRIRKKYGYPDKSFLGFRRFSGTFGSGKKSNIRGIKGRLRIDKKKKQIVLILNGEDVGYWPFTNLKQRIENKIKNMILVGASSKKIKRKEYFKFNEFEIYQYKGFNAFMCAVEKGFIKVDIRLGVYKSGGKIGKTHDHGTAFRIKAVDLSEIFDIDCS